MKKFIIIFMIFLGTSLYAFDYNEGIGVNSQMYYNTLNKTYFLGGEFYYVIPTDYTVNFLPFVEAKTWLNKINPDNIMYSSFSGNAISGGLTTNWKHIFFTVSGFYVNAKEANETVWKISDYWMTKSGACFIASYQFNNYLDKGIGFSASLGSNMNSNICFTELGINYRYISEYQIGINFYGKQKTWFIVPKKDYIRGNPFCDIYTVGLEICFLGMSIFYEHYCAHDVYSSEAMWENDQYRINNNRGQSSNGDLFGIRFKFN